MPVIEPKALVYNRVDAIRDYHAACGITRAELDVSGGIDSAVLAGLLALALGPDNVTYAHLGINSNPEQTARAVKLIHGIGGRLAVGDYTAPYQLIIDKVREDLIDAGYDAAEIDARLAADPTILGSIRSTLRAPLGRAFNRMTGGGIRHGTGNECEDRFLRFYQKGGDGEVDTNPIAMLSKAETYQLAFALAEEFGPEAKEAYYETIAALPSADLWGVGDKHNDESELKSWTGASFTYGRLDVTTGKVVNVGTIERVARFLDRPARDGDIQMGVTIEYHLFDDDPHRPGIHMDLMVDAAEKSGLFTGFPRDTITALLKGARKAERATRHKLNPNCPALGTRQELIAAGILSDNFDDYGITNH